MTSGAARLNRQVFRTSRLLEFCSQKELVLQTGHPVEQWPLVILKELMDNALDACEEAGVAPDIKIEVRDGSITITDNGPGILSSTVKSLLDFGVRVSSREAYVSPTRGAQGNALKTLVAMPFALDGTLGETLIAARGVGIGSNSRSMVSARNPGSIIAMNHFDHGPMARENLFTVGPGEVEIFTNCRRLRLAEPPPDHPAGLGRRQDLPSRSLQLI